MDSTQIDLSAYSNSRHPLGSQGERIDFLIHKLREYKNLPAKEMRKVIPMLWEVQQQCEAYNRQHGLPTINYIMEILKALEIEHFSNVHRHDSCPKSN